MKGVSVSILLVLCSSMVMSSPQRRAVAKSRKVFLIETVDGKVPDETGVDYSDYKENGNKKVATQTVVDSNEIEVNVPVEGVEYADDSDHPPSKAKYDLKHMMDKLKGRQLKRARYSMKNEKLQ